MAQQNTGVNLPGGFGGLMRYSEEYSSRFMLKPTHVVAFVLLVIAFRIALGVWLG